MANPAVEALALQALSPEVGHTFLDVGSGSGYLTMLAAHMVAYSGNAVGVDVRFPLPCCCSSTIHCLSTIKIC